MLTPNERDLYDFFYKAACKDDGFIDLSYRELATLFSCSKEVMNNRARSLTDKGLVSIKCRQGLKGMEVKILKELEND